MIMLHACHLADSPGVRNHLPRWCCVTYQHYRSGQGKTFCGHGGRWGLDQSASQRWEERQTQSLGFHFINILCTQAKDDTAGCGRESLCPKKTSFQGTQSHTVFLPLPTVCATTLSLAFLGKDHTHPWTLWIINEGRLVANNSDSDIQRSFLWVEQCGTDCPRQRDGRPRLWRDPH